MKHLFNILYSIAVLVFRGFVIKKFWMWFIMPTFINAPAISIATAIGISLLVNIINPMRSLTKREVDDMKLYSSKDSFDLSLINTSAQLIIILFSLFMGWVIHVMF